MHFVLPTPSLQHIALVKMVAAVCVSQRDIVTRIARALNARPGYVFWTKEKGEWKEIEKKVRSKVWALPLPDLCRHQLSNIIKPILMEIIGWRRYHSEIEVNNNNCWPIVKRISLPPQLLCWTMHGTVDYAKTAHLMVKDEWLSVEKRFEFACLNCLEDDARLLIGLIPNDRIRKYISAVICYQEMDHPEMDHRILIAYFACTLSRDGEQANRVFRSMNLGGWSINQYLFKVVLRKGSRATGEYFYRKVNQSEKEQASERYLMLALFRALSPTCGLLYYLSLLSERSRLFGEDIDHLLMLLLDWPMQPLFMEVAKGEWQLMDRHACATVLHRVISKIQNGFEDYDYPQLFWECWRISPAEHKQCFLGVIDQLQDLLATKREEFIILVLNEAPARLLKTLVGRKDIYEKMSPVLMDDSVICDATLMECKQTAALNSSNDRDNVEKRLRSQHVSCLVDKVMERRTKR